MAPRLLVLAVLFLPGTILIAQDEPLHRRIDTLMQQESSLPDIPLAGDTDFLRRVYFDLWGVPPQVDVIRQFVADQSLDKRTAVVDRLMASPRFERRLTETLDVMLMERRGNPIIPQDEWVAYLLQSVRDNKPWNVLAKEILTADGKQQPRAAVRFYLDRGSEPNLLTRDVGRTFFGRDLQCAQCHDHPLIDDYAQADYHGLLAFVSPGHELKIKEGDKEVAYFAERAGSDLEFESVFVKGTKHLTGARLLSHAELVEPFFVPGEEYTVAPADGILPVPKFSRRQQLAELATNGQCREFNENIANRLWATVMGKGLVHPVDLHHSANPPTHPELLKLLGNEFAQSGFNIRNFVRELVLTKTYQRAWDLPTDWTAPALQASQALPQLETQLATLTTTAEQANAALDPVLKAHQEAEAALLPAVTELNAARTKYADLGKKVAEAAKALSDVTGQVVTKQGLITSLKEAAAKAQEVAGKLPNDAELAAAAAKIAERSTQQEAELPALQKVAEEKLAAHAASVTAQQAVRPEVEAAQQKVHPLREALRQREVELLAARGAVKAAYTALRHQEERVSHTKTLAQLHELQQQINAQQTAIATATQEMQGAQAAVVAYGPTMTGAEQTLANAKQTLLSASEALAKLQAEHATQSELANTVLAAFQGAEAARQKLPEDAVLVDAATKLKTRSDELAVALVTHQQQVDTAASTAAGATEQVNVAQTALEAAAAEKSRLEQVVTDKNGQLAAAQQQLQTAQAQVPETTQSLAERLSRQATLSDLRALSPEQMCWGIFELTDVYGRYRAGEIAELDKTAPLSEADKQDPAKVLAREREIEQRVYEKLKSYPVVYATLYGNGAGQAQGEFFATVDQSLYVANAGTIVSWIAPTSGNVTERIINQADPKLAAEELYLGVLNRLPNDAEFAAVNTYLAGRPDQRSQAVQELVWSLVSSAEFRFLH